MLKGRDIFATLFKSFLAGDETDGNQRLLSVIIFTNKFEPTAKNNFLFAKMRGVLISKVLLRRLYIILADLYLIILVFIKVGI